MTQQSTAMIVGASRGLGLALAEQWCGRGWRVIATARGRSEGLEVLARRYPDSLEIEAVDIDESDSVAALRERLTGRRLDVLFVNAGISRGGDATPGNADEQDFLSMMLTNALAPVRVVERLHDLITADGVVALMSSGLGSIARAQGGWPLYSSSKAALNMLMKGFAARHPEDSRALLLVAPGWVRTALGGDDAPLSVEESIPQVVDLVEGARGKPGLRYVDRFGADLPW